MGPLPIGEGQAVMPTAHPRLSAGDPSTVLRDDGSRLCRSGGSG